MDRCRHPRSREGLPPPEGPQGHAEADCALRAVINSSASVSQLRTSRRLSTEPPLNFNSRRDNACSTFLRRLEVLKVKAQTFQVLHLNTGARGSLDTLI